MEKSTGGVSFDIRFIDSAPSQFPRGKTELRSWRDKHGIHSVGGGKRRIQKEYLFFFR